MKPQYQNNQTKNVEQGMIYNTPKIYNSCKALNLSKIWHLTSLTSNKKWHHKMEHDKPIVQQCHMILSGSFIIHWLVLSWSSLANLNVYTISKDIDRYTSVQSGTNFLRFFRSIKLNTRHVIKRDWGIMFIKILTNLVKHLTKTTR